MKADDVKDIMDEALQQARDAANAEELEAVRIQYLGVMDDFLKIMKSIKDADPAERKGIGQNANELKNQLGDLIKGRSAEFGGSSSGDKADTFDSTLPGRWGGVGTLHPITRVIQDTIEIFGAMGFTVADGPDIETEYHNFDALNTPDDHPSRDIQDTFWLENGTLLRTQTSPVQIRVMEETEPPVRIIAPGRCYRRDTTDATHSANFHQIEGLYIDDNVSMADLKGDITWFARRLMGPDVQVRFRPHFFPFTEPSVEYDFSCHVCSGSGCRVCKGSGWIEISGAGMVDPNVLKTVGYDPEKVSGYAFGMGVERIAMIKYGIPDIRMLYDNDSRFLSQFR